MERRRNRRRGSPRGRVFLWERALVWVGDGCNRAGAFLFALGGTAFQFFQENKSGLMAALPFWAFAGVLIVLGAIYSTKKVSDLKETDNTERRVV